MLLETNWLFDFSFGVADAIIFNTNPIISCTLVVTRMVNDRCTVIDITYFSNCLVEYLMANGFESTHPNLQTLFTTIITIFDGISDILIILAQYSSNCMVLFPNCCIDHITNLFIGIGMYLVMHR